MNEVVERIKADDDGAASEYDAVRGDAAGVIDLSSRARVEVRGAEAVQFLNGLITNDVKTLAAGAWMTAAFPNVQGRLLAHARVLRMPGDTPHFLFDTEAATGARLFQTLERFTLAGDFHVRDLTAQTAQFSVQGARAAAIIAATFDETIAAIERGRVQVVMWQGVGVMLIRATHTAEDGFDVFVSKAEAAPALWAALVAAGAHPIGEDVFEVLRLEAGVPRYGVDMTDVNVVLETGLDDAVSYTKGCYVGQEIIARIHWRGHVAKRLAGVLLEDEDAPLPAPGARLRTADNQKEIGRVTSSAYSPRLRRGVALALVKYDYLAPGTEAVVHAPAANGAPPDGSEVPAQNTFRARVVELPFVRGSWYDAQGDATADANANATPTSA